MAGPSRRRPLSAFVREPDGWSLWGGLQPNYNEPGMAAILLAHFAAELRLDASRVGFIGCKGEGFAPGGARFFWVAAALVQVAQVFLYGDRARVPARGVAQITLGLFQLPQFV